MTSINPYNLLALMALIPAAVIPLRVGATRDGAFWAGIGLAVLGPGVHVWGLLSQSWHTDFDVALWVSVVVCALLFAGVARLTQSGWRLSPLLMPYLLLTGLVASIIPGEARSLSQVAPPVWIDLHIVISVLTYGLLTLAAVASLSVFLQERALKRKRPTALTRLLPAVVEAENLSGRLLLWSEIVLGLGLLTGTAVQYFETGVVFHLGHKTLFSLVAFALIGALLLGHRVCGVRGRVAARVVLVAYLLLTLAYPGMKFITQVLL